MMQKCNKVSRETQNLMHAAAVFGSKEIEWDKPSTKTIYNEMLQKLNRIDSSRLKTMPSEEQVEDKPDKTTSSLPKLTNPRDMNEFNAWASELRSTLEGYVSQIIAVRDEDRPTAIAVQTTAVEDEEEEPQPRMESAMQTTVNIPDEAPTPTPGPAPAPTVEPYRWDDLVRVFADEKYSKMYSAAVTLDKPVLAQALPTQPAPAPAVQIRPAQAAAPRPPTPPEDAAAQTSAIVEAGPYIPADEAWGPAPETLPKAAAVPDTVEVEVAAPVYPEPRRPSPPRTLEPEDPRYAGMTMSDVMAMIEGATAAVIPQTQPTRRVDPTPAPAPAPTRVAPAPASPRPATPPSPAPAQHEVTLTAPARAPLADLSSDDRALLARCRVDLAQAVGRARDIVPRVAAGLADTAGSSELGLSVDEIMARVLDDDAEAISRRMVGAHDEV